MFWISIVIILFVILMVISRNHERKKEKSFLEKIGAEYAVSIPFVAGLPIAEKTMCTIARYPDKIMFISNAGEFTLAKDKIVDISALDDRQLQTQYVSSAGGAIGGAIMFGAIGAMIGGRTKEKNVATTTNYLIFTYKKEESLDYIILDATDNRDKSYDFASDFKVFRSSYGEKVQVQL